MAKAVAAESEHSIDYLTIHTIGGFEMMKVAVQATRNVEKPPKLIGVTILTSIDQQALNTDLRISGSVTDQVAHLAQLAVKAEMDGVVCSALDLPSIRKHLPASFEIITPGIRLAGSDTGDQKRVATPQQALEKGATILVIGRPITAAEDPNGAAKRIFESINI